MPRPSRRASIVTSLAAALGLGLGCAARPPRQDPIARADGDAPAATRADADAPRAPALGGSGSYRAHLGCGDERWVRLEPGPFDRGEVRVFARRGDGASGAALEVALLDGDGHELTTQRASVAAAAPEVDTVVVPFARPAGAAAAATYYARARLAAPCPGAAIDLAWWFRPPAEVGP